MIDITIPPKVLTTTLNRIRAHDPCRKGWEKLLKGLGKTQADDEPLPFSRIVEINDLDDALWCCRAEPQYDREWRLFAVWCARQVQYLMTDPRSIAALDVAERFAHGQASNDARAAARAAAQAAAWAAAQATWDAQAAQAATDHAVARAAAEAAARAAAQAVARATWDAQAAQAAARAAARDAAWAARAAVRGAARAAQKAEFLRIVNGGEQ